VTLFEKMPLDQLLGNMQTKDEDRPASNQMKLQLN